MASSHGPGRLGLVRGLAADGAARRAQVVRAAHDDEPALRRGDLRGDGRPVLRGGDREDAPLLRLRHAERLRVLLGRPRGRLPRGEPRGAARAPPRAAAGDRLDGRQGRRVRPLLAGHREPRGAQVRRGADEARPRRGRRGLLLPHARPERRHLHRAERDLRAHHAAAARDRHGGLQRARPPARDDRGAARHGDQVLPLPAVPRPRPRAGGLREDGVHPFARRTR